MTHGIQSQYGFPPPHAHTFEVLRGSQSQISPPFMNDMVLRSTTHYFICKFLASVYHILILPLTILQQAAANGNPVRESDISYSPFSVSQSMPTRYANSVSSISDPTISIAEVLIEPNR